MIHHDADGQAMPGQNEQATMKWKPYRTQIPEVNSETRRAEINDILYQTDYAMAQKRINNAFYQWSNL